MTEDTRDTASEAQRAAELVTARDLRAEALKWTDIAADHLDRLLISGKGITRDADYLLAVQLGETLATIAHFDRFAVWRADDLANIDQQREKRDAERAEDRQTQIDIANEHLSLLLDRFERALNEREQQA